MVAIGNALIEKNVRIPPALLRALSVRNLSGKRALTFTKQSVVTVSKRQVENIIQKKIGSGFVAASTVGGINRSIKTKLAGIMPIIIQGNLFPNFLVKFPNIRSVKNPIKGSLIASQSVKTSIAKKIYSTGKPTVLS